MLKYRNAFSSWGFLLLISIFGQIIAATMYFVVETPIWFALCFIVIPITCSLIQLGHRARICNMPWYIYPNFWVVVSITMIFFLAPVLTIYGNSKAVPPFQDWDWRIEYGSTLMLGSVALFGLLLGSIKTNLVPSTYSDFSNKYFWKTNINLLTSTILITYGIFGYLIWIRSQGGFQAIFSNRFQLQAQGFTFNNGYLYDSLLVVTGVLTALFAHKRSQGRFKFGIVEIGLILSMIPYVARGDRSVFLYTLTVLAIIKVLISRKMKIKFSSKIILLFLIPLLVVVPRIYRHADNINLSAIASGYSVSNISQTVTGLDTAMVPALTILRSQLGKTVDYQIGKSYLKGLFKPIPRAIWKSKPMELDRQLNIALFPRTSNQVGFSFSGISEPLVNFGIIGVIIFFFALGKLNNYLTTFSETIDLRNIILLAWISGFMFILIRGNLSTDYQRLLFPLIPALITIRSTKETVNVKSA